ncbi:MAG TPA: phage tail protein [Rhizomicrobium sp.]
MNRFALAAASATLLYAGAASAQQANAYVSQIMPMAGSGCPRGWTAAEGQILPIAQNTVLFSLIRNTYGGDGKTTFALPNLKGGTIGPAAQPVAWCIATTGVLPPKP